MRRIDLGHGVVGFELEGQADHIGSLDPEELRRLGWSEEIVNNYIRYKATDLHNASGPALDESLPAPISIKVLP